LSRAARCLGAKAVVSSYHLSPALPEFTQTLVNLPGTGRAALGHRRQTDVEPQAQEDPAWVRVRIP